MKKQKLLAVSLALVMLMNAGASGVLAESMDSGTQPVETETTFASSGEGTLEAGETIEDLVTEEDVVTDEDTTETVTEAEEEDADDAASDQETAEDEAASGQNTEEAVTSNQSSAEAEDASDSAAEPADGDESVTQEAEGEENTAEEIPADAVPLGGVSESKLPVCEGELAEEDMDRFSASRSVEDAESRYGPTLAVDYSDYKHRKGNYYNKLNDLEKEIYSALYAVTFHPDDPDWTIQQYYKADPESDKFLNNERRAYIAMIYDHPELFWLDQGPYWFCWRYIPRSSTGREYSTVYFYLNKTFYAYEREMTRFNSAVKSFISTINMKKKKPRIALQVHDKLMELCSYDWDTWSRHPDLDYTYTAYGAFVANSSGQSHKCVCAGYARAYQYICQYAGIPCYYVNGYGDTVKNNSTRHAWNVIKLSDGEWYEVDVTWDDARYDNMLFERSSPYYDLSVRAFQDEKFRGRLTHLFFGRTTKAFKKISYGKDKFTYKGSDGRYIWYEGTEVHLRHTKDETNPWDKMSAKAVKAKGKKYTYSYLAG